MPGLDTPLSQGRSLVHGLDPRARLLGLCVFSLPLALAHSLAAALLGLVLAALLLALARPPAGVVLRRLLAVNFFTAFLWAFVPLGAPGEALFHLGPLAYTREGVHLALLLTFKTNAAFLAVTALVASIAPPELGCALQSLGLPEKLCHLLLMTHRYLFVIQREYQRLFTAARARGFTPRTSSHTYRTYAWLLGMLLVKSWDRAERVHQAMLCRGFKGKFYCLTNMRWRPADALFLGVSLAAALAVFLTGSLT